jgi:hypothetical protein
MVLNSDINKILGSIRLLLNILGISIKTQFGQPIQKSKPRMTSRLATSLVFVVSFAMVSVGVIYFKRSEMSIPALTEISATTCKLELLEFSDLALLTD